MERLTIRGDHGVYMAPGWDFHIDPDDYELVQKVLDRIATFEDLLERVEMEPQELVEVLQRNFNADLMLSMTAHYLQVEPQDAVLAMRAGARAIVNNRRLEGAIYVWDFRGKQGGPKEISYYDAAVLLAETADKLYQQESSGKGNADG